MQKSIVLISILMPLVLSACSNGSEKNTQAEVEQSKEKIYTAQELSDNIFAFKEVYEKCEDLTDIELVKNQQCLNLRDAQNMNRKKPISERIAQEREYYEATGKL